MSAVAATSPAAGAPVPTAVRAEGAGAVRSYRAALGFESMLLEQRLSEALPESAGGEAAGFGEEAEAGGAFGSGGDPSLASLPETVVAAVVEGGGTGLAREMYRSFEGSR
jgi:hypothetical protein